MINLDHQRLITTSLATREDWSKLGTALNTVWSQLIYAPLSELRDIRNPDGLSKEYLIKSLASLGFNYRSDLLAEEDYRRFLRFKHLYDAESGTENTIKFMGFIKNTVFSVHQLWSKGEDYVSGFLRSEYVPSTEPRITDAVTVTESSINTHWYPTSHVDISYDASMFPVSSEIERDIPDLFYQLAPIHLVLRYVIWTYYADMMTAYVAGLHHSHTINSGYADLVGGATKYLAQAHTLKSIETSVTTEVIQPTVPFNVVPVVVEPPLAMTRNRNELWIGVANGAVNWGGGYIWISTDNGLTYSCVGQVNKSAVSGVLTSVLPSSADVDYTSVLQVDMSQSKVVAPSYTQAQVNNAETLYYLDGEFISYRDSTNTGGYNYDLSYIRRGQNDSVISAHSIGSQMVRIDDTLFKWVYPASLQGTSVRVKVTSFNAFGEPRAQELVDVPYSTYLIKGPTYRWSFKDKKSVDASTGFNVVAAAGQRSYINELGIMQYETTANKARVNHIIIDDSATPRTAHTNLNIYSKRTLTEWQLGETTAGSTTTSPVGNLVPKFIPSTNSSLHYVAPGRNSTGLTNRTTDYTAGHWYTFTIHAKAAGYDIVLPERPYVSANGDTFNDWGSVSFNLTTGTYTSTGVGATSITKLDDGWCRLSLTRQCTQMQTARSQPVWFINLYGTFAGNGTSGTYFDGAQTEAATEEWVYIPTNGAVASVVAPANPTIPEVECEGLVIENTSRTNFVPNSAMFGASTASTWGTAPTGWDYTPSSKVSIVGTGIEYGMEYIDVRLALFNEASGSDTFINFCPATVAAVAAASGQTWTASTYVRQIYGSIPNDSSVVFELYTRGTTASYVSTETGFSIMRQFNTNKFRRFTHTQVLANAGTELVESSYRFAWNAGASAYFVLRLYGPQLERNYESSYIRTTGTADTRPAEYANITDLTGIGHNHVQGTHMVTFDHYSSAGSGYPELFRTSANSDGTGIRLHSYMNGAVGFATATKLINAASATVYDIAGQDSSSRAQRYSLVKHISSYLNNGNVLTGDNGESVANAGPYAMPDDAQYVVFGLNGFMGHLQEYVYAPRVVNTTEANDMTNTHKEAFDYAPYDDTIPNYVQAMRTSSTATHTKSNGAMIISPAHTARNDFTIKLMRANYVPNGEMLGAVAGIIGSGGALPTNWSINAGTAVVEILDTGYDGNEYIDIGLTGTTASDISLQFGPNTMAAASINERWINSCKVKYLDGVLPQVVPMLTVYDAALAQIAQHTSTVTMNSLDYIQASVSEQITTNAQYVQGGIKLPGSGSVNIKLRIACPQLEPADGNLVQNSKFINSSMGRLDGTGSSTTYNRITNSVFGAATLTTMPASMTWATGTVVGTSTVVNGITFQIVGVGIDEDKRYIDISVSGTASAHTTQNLWLDYITATSAAPDQAWSTSAHMKLVSGSIAGINAGFDTCFNDSGFAVLATKSSSPLAIDSTLRQYSYNATSIASTAYVRPSLRLKVNSGAIVSGIIRIENPQLEQTSSLRNLLLKSEDLSGYTKGGATVTPYAALALDNTYSASLIERTNAAGNMGYVEHPSVNGLPAGTYVFNCRVKQVTNTQATIQADIVTGGVAGFYTFSTNSFTTVSYGATPPALVSVTASDLADGWKLLELIYTTSAVANHRVRVAEGRTDIGSQTVGNQMYAWGFQLSSGAVAVPYIAVHAAAALEGTALNSTIVNIYKNSGQMQVDGPNGFGIYLDCIATTNVALAPDNTNTASRLTLNSGTYCSFIHSISSRLLSDSAAPYTFSVWVKSDGSNPTLGSIYLQQDGGSFTKQAERWFVLTNEWQRVSVSGVRTNDGVGLRAAIGLTGTAGNKMLVWGGQVETGARMNTYVPTTLNFPVLTTGTIPTVVTMGSANLKTLNSGSLGTNWTSSSTPIASISGTGELDDGSEYVDVRISGTSGSAAGINFRNVLATLVEAKLGQRFTASMYASIVSGSLTNVSNIILSLAERTSDGATTLFAWNQDMLPTLTKEHKRYEISAAMGSATVGRAVLNAIINYGVGAVDVTIRFSQPQLERYNAVASAYLPTTLQGATDYIDTTDKAVIDAVTEFRGTRIESLSTNIQKYSSTIGAIGSNFSSATNWAQQGVTSVELPSLVMPHNVVKVIEDTSTGAHAIMPPLPVSPGVTENRTHSVYVKAGTCTKVAITNKNGFFTTNDYNAKVDLLTGLVTLVNYTAGSVVVDNIGNGWYRIGVTISISTGTGFRSISVQMLDDSNSLSYTGTNRHIFICAPQVEVGSRMSSYIPTNGANATRTLEYLYSPDTNALNMNCNVGTIEAEFEYSYVDTSVAGQRAFEFSNGTSNERLGIGITSTGTLGMYVVDNALSVTNNTITATPAIFVRYKSGSSYRLNLVKTSNILNAVITDTSAGMPTWDRLNIGTTYSNGNQLEGWVRRLRGWSCIKPLPYVDPVAPNTSGSSSGLNESFG